MHCVELCPVFAVAVLTNHWARHSSEVSRSATKRTLGRTRREVERRDRRQECTQSLHGRGLPLFELACKNPLLAFRATEFT